jgi:hypothetical protein
MSYESYRKLRDQVNERRGVKIENRDSKYQQVDSLKNLFEDTADAQRNAPRPGPAPGIPNNSAGLGYDPRNGDVFENGPAKNPKGWTVVESFRKSSDE